MMTFELADDRGDKMRELRLAKMMKRQGVEVHIISPDAPKGLGFLHRVPGLGGNIWMQQLSFLVFGLPKAFLTRIKHKPDVYFSRGEIPNFTSWLINKIWKTPYVIDSFFVDYVPQLAKTEKEEKKYTVYSVQSKENKFKKVVRKISNRIVWRSCSLFTVEMVYQGEAINAYGVDKDKIMLVQPGLELENYTGAQKKKEYSAIYIGYLDESHYKMIEPLVREVNNISRKDPGFKFLIIGGGPYKEVIEEYTKENGIEDKVVLKGRLPHDEVIKYLKKSKIAITYTTGQVVYEYCALGLPIIAFEGIDTRQVLGDAALYAKDWTDYVSKLIKLNSDIKLQKKLGERSKELAKSRSIEAISKRFVSRLNEVTSN